MIRSRFSSNPIIAQRQIIDALPKSMTIETKMVIVKRILG